jgi:hypothetical protein
MSASVVISTCGVRNPSIRIASRMMGCWTSSICSTCSSREYLRKIPSTNGRITVTYTYLSIAAAIRKPVLSR